MLLVPAQLISVPSYGLVAYRGRGVAQSLLDRVCEDAARDGYDYMEVYPFADKGFEFQYHGTTGMYERNGFVEAADLNYVKGMRKRLRPVPDGSGRPKRLRQIYW